MSFLLYHPPTWSPRLLAHTLQAEQVELREVETPGEVRGEDRPTAYLLDPTARTHVTPQALTALRDQGSTLEVRLSGALPLQVLLTHREARALGLREGLSLWAEFLDLHVIPAREITEATPGPAS